MSSSKSETVRPDPAALALARVRAAAKSSQRASAKSTRRSHWSGNTGGMSGPGPDARDPRTLGSAIKNWANQGGFSAQLTVAGLTSRWAEIVGELVASHVTADEYHRLPDGGRLVVTADSPAWESTMKYQTRDLKRRISEELGSGLVTVIEIRGLGRTRKRGWRVQSGRRS